MYRRRTPKAQPVNPVEPSKQEHPKPKEEKNEPVIKAVIVVPVWVVLYVFSFTFKKPCDNNMSTITSYGT